MIVVKRGTYTSVPLEDWEEAQLTCTLWAKTPFPENSNGTRILHAPEKSKEASILILRSYNTTVLCPHEMAPTHPKALSPLSMQRRPNAMDQRKMMVQIP